MRTGHLTVNGVSIERHSTVRPAGAEGAPFWRVIDSAGRFHDFNRLGSARALFRELGGYVTIPRLTLCLCTACRQQAGHPWPLTTVKP